MIKIILYSLEEERFTLAMNLLPFFTKNNFKKNQELDMTQVLLSRNLKKVLSKVQNYAFSIVSYQPQKAKKYYEILEFLNELSRNQEQLFQLWDLIFCFEQLQKKQFKSIIQRNNIKKFQNFDLHKKRLQNIAQNIQIFSKNKIENQQLHRLLYPIYQQIRDIQKLKKAQNLFQITYKICNYLDKLRKQNNFYKEIKEKLNILQNYQGDKNDYKIQMSLISIAILSISNGQFSNFKMAKLRMQDNMGLLKSLQTISRKFQSKKSFQETIKQLKYRQFISLQSQKLNEESYQLLSDVASHFNSTNFILHYLTNKISVQKTQLSENIIKNKKKYIFLTTLQPLEKLQRQINQQIKEKKKLQNFYNKILKYYQKLNQTQQVPQNLQDILIDILLQHNTKKFQEKNQIKNQISQKNKIVMEKVQSQKNCKLLLLKYQEMENKYKIQLDQTKIDLSNKIIKLEKLLQEKNKQFQKIKQKYQRQLDIVKQDYMDEIQKINNKLIDLGDINQHLKIESSNYKKKINQKDQALKEIEQKSSSNRVYELYFQGDVFDNEPYEQLVWFVDQLQNHCEMRIRKTRLLYRKDDYSNVNFHVYFDNLQDIVLVIKLKNGMILAGYTHPAFIKGQKQPGQTGFIFSFHTRQVFGQKREGVQNMNQYPRPIIYDEYYMIFGNNEIKLKFKDNMIFSNFDKLQSFYDNKKQPVNCLIGEGNERQSEILTYEIFQVRF